jgi:hypothetical protein
MSLLNSPMGILLFREHETARLSHTAHAIHAHVADTVANRKGAGCSCEAQETHGGTSEQCDEVNRPCRRPRLTFIDARTYVGHVTGVANERRSWTCQGLHNGFVLPYVSSRTVLLTVARHLL